MFVMTRLIPLPLLVLAVGCTPGGYCIEEQPYQSARSVPEVRSAGGVTLPESDSALRIPPAPANAEPFGAETVNAEGDTVIRCLDKPPGLPEVETPPEEAEPEAPEALPLDDDD